MSTHFEERPTKLQWDAKEVVRIVDHEPHLLVRVAVAGRAFPHRAAVPVMRIVGPNEEVALSWFTEISEDGHALRGYFATDLPEEGTIEFGYHDQPLTRLRAKFHGKSIERLDRRRLEKEIVETSTPYLKRKRGY